MVKVQRRQCKTCIYKNGSGFDVKKLEAQVADGHGFFKTFRACHHASRQVICRGFWDRHKDKFQLGQLAQRLRLVEFVNIDRMKWLTKSKRG